MAVKVKIKRTKLIARLEEIRDEHDKNLKERERKFAAEAIRARQAAARDLRKKADKMDDLDVYLSSETIYRDRGNRTTEDRTNVLVIESPVVVPRRPEPHRAIRPIAQAIALLDQSDDEFVSVSTDDLKYYGAGSLLGLED